MNDKKPKSLLDISNLSLQQQVKKEEEEEKMAPPKLTIKVPPLTNSPTHNEEDGSPLTNSPHLTEEDVRSPLCKRPRIMKESTGVLGSAHLPDCSTKSVCPIALQWDYLLLGSKGSSVNSPLTVGSVSLPLGQYPSGQFHTDGQLGSTPSGGTPSGRLSLTGAERASAPLPVFNTVQSGSISQGRNRADLVSIPSIKLSRLINTPRTPSVRRSIFDKEKDRKERDSARKKLKRAEMTPEQRKQESEKAHSRRKTKLEAEAPEQQKDRLAKDKLEHQIKREEETPERRQGRLNKTRVHQQVKIKAETLEQRNDRLNKAKVYQQIKREEEPPEEKKGRQVKDAGNKRIKRENETPAQRNLRLQQARVPNPRFGSAVCRRRHVDENGYTWGCASEYAGHWPNYMKMRVFGRDTDTAPKICPFCKAYLFDDEDYNHCCMHGDIQVEPLPDAPELIQHLCDPTVRTHEAENFREQIVSYNTGLAFGSLSTERQMPPGRGPPVVLMNGQLSQQIGNLRPGMTEQGQRKDPLFGQVYMVSDLNAAIDTRMRTSPSRDISRTMMSLLEALIRNCHPFAQKLMSLGKQLAASESGQQTDLPPPERFRLSILDCRPSTNQVCALFDTQNNDPPDSNLCGIWLMTEGNRLIRIGIHNRNADWIQFPIMFPFATQTYGRGIPINSQRSDTATVVELDDMELLRMIESDNVLPVAVSQNTTNPGSTLEAPLGMQNAERQQPIVEPIADQPNDIREGPPRLVLRDVLAYEDDPVNLQFTTEFLLAMARWAVRNQLRRTIVISPNYFAGYYNLLTGNTLTAEEIRRDEQETRANNREHIVYANRFENAPDLHAEDDSGPMSFRENFTEQHTLSDTELIVIPVMLAHHYAMAIYEHGTGPILYFDSLGWSLSDGTVNGVSNPVTPNVKRDLIHAVRSIMGDAAPDNLTVRVHQLEERAHNRQNDLTFSDRQHNCGLHALLILEAYLFQNRNCYIYRLDIVRERERVIMILKHLCESTLPRAYYTPYFDGPAFDVRIITPTDRSALTFTAPLIAECAAQHGLEPVPATLPLIEPSNWNDDIDVVDVEIPQNIQQTITVDDDDVEVVITGVEQSWAPYDRDGYRHFRRYPRNQLYVEYRVPLPAEYLQEHPHIIRDRTGLRWEMLIDLMLNNNAWADDHQIWAYMARISLFGHERIAVLNPMFTETVRLMAERGETVDHLAHTYGAAHSPDIIAIPVYMPDHWVLGIYEKQSNRTHYFDSFNNSIPQEIHQSLRDTILRFYPLGSGTGNHYLPVLYEVPFNQYNRQVDGFNCGFHVCLIWESWLTFPQRTTLIEYLSLPHERQRILSNLVSVFSGDDLDFTPLSRSVQPLLAAYLATLPHQDLIRTVREAMGAGTTVGRSRRRPIPSAPVTEPTAPTIGRSVPYHTDATIPSRIVESMQPDNEDDVDGAALAEPFIASGRVVDSVRPYCPRKRGKAQFLSRRKWLKPHLRRRGAILRHHPLLSYGKLTQLYLIRQAWLIFADEEDYQRRVQNAPEYRRTVRSELIAHHERNLRRRNADNPNVELQKIGCVYRMPKTGRQSAENTSMNITKAMALRKAIKPNCGTFVTFTFNCKCPEMVEMTGSGSNPADYPDLCCLLATAKFKQLLTLVSGPNGVLGPVKGWCWSLEYQKRGNKHYHLVLMNDPDDPIDPNTPEYVDQYITSKIPDRPVDGDPDYDAKKAYYDLVTLLYIHTCEDNEEAACRAGRPNNDCRFGFPQPYSEYTTFNEHNGTVTYARPSPEQGGNSFIKQGVNGQRKIIDNRYVVPHNRALTLAMGCHICVKFVSKFDIWFYLFKYSYKLDKKVLAALYVQDPNDPNVFHADPFNVRRALTFQGPFEAYDILTSTRWVGRSHDVTLLSVHLEGQEPVFFIAGHEDAAERRVRNSNFRTRWTAYHDLCAANEEARQCRFDQIEEFFTFHTRDPDTGVNSWQYLPRGRAARGGQFVCMIYPPNPHNRDLFATYLLSLTLRGIQSFEDLRSLNRPSDPDYDPSRPTVVHDNAIEACVRRGLLTDDSTWREVMRQVSCTIHNSRQFIRFFATLLHTSQPSDPKALLDEYVDRLLPPPQPGRANDRDIRYQQMLRQIQRQLEEHGRSMRDFGLPEPEPDDRLLDDRVNEDLIPPVYDPATGEPVEMTAEERAARANQRYQTCNAGQREFVDFALARLRELAANPTNMELSNTILLQGEGGTGKTHALNSLIEKCHALGVPIGVCASTGIAATHLLGGRTAHSLFGIRVKDTNADTPVDDVQFSHIKADSYKGRLLKKYRIFIIDEVGMLHVDNIYTINMLLKDLHDTSVRFGRVLMIFTGDERQIMPIVKGVDPLSDRQADASFFFSQDCRLSTRILLTENMRVQQGQANFLEWQRKIGSDGYQHVKFPHDTRNRLTRYICVPRQFARYNEDAFIREVFNADVFADDPMLLARRVILAPHNTTVNMINDRVASLMPPERPVHTYLSTNVPDAYDVYDPTTVIFAADNLQSISSSDIPDHSLTLIVGMPVMCMYNLDVPNGICNGTVLIVERLESVVAWCRVNTRHGQRLVPIVPMKFAYSSNGFKFTRTQMPLRRAFCVTNNRSQGGTYDVVGYHALRPIWAHGMLYTAATRVTRADGFSILCPPLLTYHHPGRDEMFATTRNVVHPRVSGRTETITAEPHTLQLGEQHVIDEQDMDYGPEFDSYNQDR